MKHLELFEGYINKKALYGKPKEVGFIEEPVKIRIDIKSVPHAGERQLRHGLDNIIEDGDIIEAVELAIEELTIALMQNVFDIEDRRGQPNRFLIRNTDTDLNIVCVLKPGENEFTLTVITIMIKPDYEPFNDQFVIEVSDSGVGQSYYHN